MTNKECVERLKKLNDMIEDYLDMMEIDEADYEKESKDSKKEDK